MKTTNLTILILTAMDIGIFILAHWFDRKFYVPAKRILQNMPPETFFRNLTFDEPLNHFLLSKGCTLLISGVLAGVGGLLISSLIAEVWMMCAA